METRKQIGRRVRRYAAKRGQRGRTPYQARGTTRSQNLQRFGFATDFSTEEVELLQQWKLTGVSVSEAARRMNCSRDRVQTVYKHTQGTVVYEYEDRPVVAHTRAKTSIHLDKAKELLRVAKELIGDADLTKEPDAYKRVAPLFDVAAIQSGVAQAEALERMAWALERLANPLFVVGQGGVSNLETDYPVSPETDSE